MTLAPLSGRCIVVTRPRHQSRPLAEALRSLGANVIEAPAIRIAPPADYLAFDEALGRLASYDWVVFTSANAIETFFTRLSPRTPPRSVSFAAIGPATGDALHRKGYEAAVVPERFVAEEVFRALTEKTSVAGMRFLLPRAEIAREALPRLLEAAGAEVDVVTAYRTVPSRDEITSAVERVKRGEVDVVTFTSPSTVRSFFDGIQLSDIEGKFTCASIGPITSAALGELGFEVGIEAESYTSQGLVEAIARHYERM